MGILNKLFGRMNTQSVLGLDDVEQVDLNPEECTVALIKALANVCSFEENDPEIRRCLSYIKGGADMSERGDYQATPLMMAVQRGSIDVIRAMVQKGANVNKYGSKNGTPLIEAVQNGRMDIAQFLVTHGADVNIVSMDGASTALHHAAINGYTKIAEFLIANGADADCRNRFGTAEEVALIQCHSDTAKSIAKMKKKKKPSRRASWEDNPVQYRDGYDSSWDDNPTS